MQISTNHNLPVIYGLRQEPLTRDIQARPPRQPVAAKMPSDWLGEQAQNQTRQRPPLFMQALSDANLPRKGQQAMRTYHDVAMAGDREELVNRINETV